MTVYILTPIAVLLGILAGYLYFSRRAAAGLGSAREQSEKILTAAENEKRRLLQEGEAKTRERLLEMKEKFEEEVRENTGELKKRERRLSAKEEVLDRKLAGLDAKEDELAKKRQEIQDREQRLQHEREENEKYRDEILGKLEQVAQLSREEAKQQLIAGIEAEAKHEAAKRIRQIEEEARESAEKRAKNIIATAISRYAGEYVTERTVTVVNLPNEEMKGRIIGREGRNIRAIEAATGVDLIIDDTPEAVVVSCFDPIRREVAAMTLQKLISDGRIHPGRIEEVVKKAEKTVAQKVREAGDQATFDLGLHGIHPEILRLVGTLQFRYSYAQNIYQHSLEVAFLCGVMANELGLNVKLAKRAGLLHDIGKAIDHEVEGSHAIIGAEFAKKHGEQPEVWHAIGAHHEEYKVESIIDVLVMAADALSGARPGARREMLESYVKRLEDLERISNSFKGVEKSYAIQAGRELRIIVESEQVSDEDTVVLSRDIARRIEQEMTYPGQIRVMVIRETRAVEIAK